MKKKGFTLVELLAVIIILGVLMLIAIPSVTNYINNSRKETYANTGKELIKGASHLVTKSNDVNYEGELDFTDTDTTYYIPYTCINTDKKAKSPYGDFEEAYVVVTLDEKNNYQYYFYSKDTQGIGIYPITEEKALSADCIKTGIDRLSTNIGIGKRKNIKVYNSDCSEIAREAKATEHNPNPDGTSSDKNAVFLYGGAVNNKMKQLANDSSVSMSFHDTNIKLIARSDTEPTEENKQKANTVSDINSEVPIYMWFDNGTIYWWSEDLYPSLSGDSSSMFYYLMGLEHIDDLDLFDTSKVMTMQNMFYYCNHLLEVDISNFDTSLVTSFSYMFFRCEKINHIDLSNLNTPKLSSMIQMFYDCGSLDDLDVSGIDTSHVTSMAWMFVGCKFKTVDLSDWDTSSLTNIRYMFWTCYSMEYIDLSTFNTSKITNMEAVFASCTNLKSIDLSSWDMSKVTTTSDMFISDDVIETINMTGWDTSSNTSIYRMFHGCKALKSLDLSSWDTSKVTTMMYAFAGCNSLTSLDLSNFNTSNVKSMYGMFNGLWLESIDVSHFDTSNVTDMSRMFFGCKNMKTIDLSNFNTSNVTTFHQMFEECTSLENVNLTSFNTSKVTNMSRMFLRTQKLETLDLSSFDTSNVTDMGEFIRYNEKLVTVYVGNNWNMDKVTNSIYMFNYCFRIVGQNGTTYNSSDTSDINYARVDCKDGIPGYFTLKTV